jgi:Centromere DNA-binding protein complex CBF3 subunit, domain 2
LFSPAQIRRAGKWNDDVMTRTYLLNLFRDFMRKISGHFHEGRYFLSRAQIEPSEELKSKIFPWVNKIIDDMMHNRCKVNLSGKGFLLFMKYFKTVFLQDSVILRARWPNHPNFQFPLFQSAEYAEFARQVQEACANPEPRYNKQISTIIPAVERELHGLRKKTSAGHNRSYYQVEALARDMRTGLTILAYNQNYVNYRLD